MRRVMFFIFLANIAATPFMIGTLASGGSEETPNLVSPQTVPTTTLSSLEPCDLLNGDSPEFQDIIDHYGDIQRAAEELGIETDAAGC